MRSAIRKVSGASQRSPMDVYAKGKPLTIIGISAGYHDSACCLTQDGVLVAAAQEERFSRVKHDKSFPRRAFRQCLAQAGITIADIDCLAYYEDPCLKLGRQIWMSLAPGTPAARREAVLDRLARITPQRAIRDLLAYEGPMEIVDHHLSHAASSLFLCLSREIQQIQERRPPFL